jgi:hypothetical protein
MERTVTSNTKFLLSALGALLLALSSPVAAQQQAKTLE